jgi:hypothetical protein
MMLAAVTFSSQPNWNLEHGFRPVRFVWIALRLHLMGLVNNFPNDFNPNTRHNPQDK